MLKNKELSLKDLTGQRLWQLQLSLKGPEPIRVQAAAGLLGPSPQEGPCRMPGAGCTRGCCCAARVLGAGRAPAPLRGTRVAARSRGWGRRPEPRREGSLSLCPSLPSFLCSQVCWPTLASGSLPGERLNHAERLRHAVPRLGLPQLQSVGGGSLLQGGWSHLGEQPSPSRAPSLQQVWRRELSRQLAEHQLSQENVRQGNQQRREANISSRA